MKGYVTVQREDLLSAIIGFCMRYDNAKEILRRGVNLYYEKHYVNGSWWKRFGNHKLTAKQFARKNIPPFCTWDELLYEVLNEKETDEVAWFSYTSESAIEPLKALYKASDCLSVINVDNDMAKFIVKHKNYLENAQ